MTVKALYEYDYPAADRAELFGDDQIVYVHWIGNLLFCSAAAVRVPQGMPWGTFVTDVVHPWAATDPDFDPGTITGWTLGGEAFAPDDGTSLTDAGVGHKSLLKFTTAS
ncbi:phenol hydroxylase [Gordonia amarae]|uniref:Phenol hydroxylase n=2 Tax=Gordonia amarae TaxID=36821 RepID=A0A857KPZ1_9ACTN|nr:phenol hydroxylase subunit P4 [Gordonia amarae]MCS3876473.1 phenol hydroxylase P4 protein [Gordonia amarae]QHN19383.1 phenol hydroxylase [Gordonia amarae]QHN23859.1 phenol hydroxylase [Gordonia amarae]QHN32769.1 phenol hydroxylase [Gordonia amarae]QHN41488.1 phenol hydroxylase [Gordonia amarae]